MRAKPVAAAARTPATPLTLKTTMTHGRRNEKGADHRGHRGSGRGSAMIHRIICKLGFHAWREVGSVCVYGDGKWIGPFMQFEQRAIKRTNMSACQHCNKRKERITHG